MGGLGSGRHWLYKRNTVEECLTLDINKLVKDGLLHRLFGEVRWCRGGEENAYVNYWLKRDPVYVLTLCPFLIRRDERIPLTQDIPLVTMELHSGGKRYWFTCPNCGRRVGKLHLPHGAERFLCRNCYDLTYKSCQECHKFDRLLAGMGIHPSVGKRLFRRN